MHVGGGGGCPPTFLEGFPGPPGPARLQKCTPNNLARLPRYYYEVGVIPNMSGPGIFNEMALQVDYGGNFRCVLHHFSSLTCLMGPGANVPSKSTVSDEFLSIDISSQDLCAAILSVTRTDAEHHGCRSFDEAYVPK